MPDNTPITAGTGTNIATRTVTYSGDTAMAQAVGLVTFAGADDAKTVADVPAGEGAAATALRVDLATDGTVVGGVTETAPGTDTASSGLNGRLQRIAQRLTSLIALLPAALGAGGGLKVEGNVAHDAVDSGNPIKIGGHGRASAPTPVADDDRVDAWFYLDGAQYVRALAFTGDNQQLIATNMSIDDVTASATLMRQQSWGMLFNGTTEDRQRGNVDATLLASAARTATVSSSDQTNYNSRGALITIDVTAITATPSLVVTVEAKDALSGKYVTLLTSAAITGVSTVQLAVYPGVTAAANLAASMILPRTWRVTVTPADADSATYSVGASTIL